MPRRRINPSALDAALEKYGAGPSGGKVGVLRHFLNKDGNPTREYYEFRTMQRIGTRDPASRAKFNRRSIRKEMYLSDEHAFIHGLRFSEPDYRDFYNRHPGRDGLGELEATYWDVYQRGYKRDKEPRPRPLSLIAEDLRDARRNDKTFHDHFSDEEINHVLRHITIRALRQSKLGAS